MMAVKVGGMCWVISTGARSITPPICAITALSACGPPVEAPISSTRGGVTGIGRSARPGAASTGFWPGCSGGAAPAGMRAAGCAMRNRFARSPSWRIFSSRSRRKVREPVTSRLLSGLGI